MKKGEVMTSEEVLTETYKSLSAVRKQELLDFAEFLKGKEIGQKVAKEFYVRSKRMGFRKDLNYDKTSELIEEIEGAGK
jgi:hypothetical protein